MSTPFLGQVSLFSFNFAPKGWAQCNGQSLPINQNQALFALLGTTYGGNGTTTFNLPNLQGRVPVHVGNGIVQGQTAGEQAHTLTVPEMAAHAHPVFSNTGTPNGPLLNNTWATQSGNAYNTSGNATMNNAAVGNQGGSQPHNNMQPFLTLNLCIALQGIFPSRN
jgi:microcystin-dependent protein